MEEGRAKPKVILSPEQALKRAQRYCAYQERSQQEVRDKLYSWGLHRREVESLLVELISDGFLKEERFAHAFAGGKFRIKKWGRVRIEQALKGKQVSSPLIRQALAGIDDREYRKTLESVLRTRLAASKESDPFIRNRKAADYAIRRGFEPELVWSILRDQE